MGTNVTDIKLHEVGDIWWIVYKPNATTGLRPWTGFFSLSDPLEKKKVIFISQNSFYIEQNWRLNLVYEAIPRKNCGVD